MTAPKVTHMSNPTNAYLTRLLHIPAGQHRSTQPDRPQEELFQTEPPNTEPDCVVGNGQNGVAEKGHRPDASQDEPAQHPEGTEGEDDTAQGAMRLHVSH